MASYRVLLGASIVVAGAGVAMTSCLDATEIRIDISTTAQVCDKKPHTDVLLNGESAPLAQQSDCVNATSPNIGSVVVLPKASNDERVLIRVVGTIDSTTNVDQCAKDFATPGIDPKKLANCIEAKRSMAFIAHKPLEIPIVLDPICAGKQCDPGFTCGATGECIADTTTCDGAGRCGGADAGVVDASVRDATTTTDAWVDAGAPAIPMSISARGNTTCVVTAMNHVQCWGDNTYGQMGMLSPTNETTPTQVPLKDVQRIVLGKGHACGIGSSGALTCWGTNDKGQVNGTAAKGVLTQSTVNKMVAKHVAVGDTHTCAFGLYGADAGNPTKVYCWGDFSAGQYLNGTDGSLTANDSANAGSALDMSAGSNHTCMLVNTNQMPGEVVCWGATMSQLGQVGTGQYQPITSVNQTLMGQTSLSAGADHNATAGASIYWWGDNSNAVMTGDGGGPASSSSALQLTLMLPQPLLSVADDHVCATDGKKVVCWGSATSIALGAAVKGTPLGFVTVPLPVGAIVGLATGTQHSCAIVVAGSGMSSKQVWCWGGNLDHQLGSNIPSSTPPVKVTLANE